MERLKDNTDLDCFVTLTYLHSSMERLKVYRTEFQIQCKIYLHSSMERLKDPADVQLVCAGRHLHSSMERLKGVYCGKGGNSGNKFTFQYGEIKRPEWNQADSSRLDLHSSMERLKACPCRSQSRPAAIYIPVWRD